VIDNPLMLVAALIAMAILLITVASVMLMREFAAGRLERRVLAAVGDPHTATVAPGQLGALGRLLHGLGKKLRSGSGIYSEQDLLALETMISAAGLNANRLLPVVLGAKVMFAVLVPCLGVAYGIVAGFQAMSLVLIVSATLPLALLGPDWILHFVRRPYVAALRRGLPDALDLLVICTEAGMSLEMALEQVAREIAASNRAMSVALTKLLDELRVLPDRREAFTNFGQRSGVDGFRRLATMLGQTLQYGTPIAEALRAVAADLRRERMLGMEAKCAKLPVMLILPLVAFIMPALFIVLAASPFLRILDTLGQMTLLGKH